MKFFTAILVSTFASSVGAFAPPSRPSSSTYQVLGAATLDVAPSAETTTPPVVMNGASSTTTSEPIIEKAWPVMQENFVKDSDRVLPGRYNDKTNSIALPFLPRPTALDGSHAGDYGFDPLGLSEKLDFYAMQESEIRHSRLALLAVVGWPMSELLAPSWMLQGEGGCAPSVLNGVNPLSALTILGFLTSASYFEYKTSLRRTQTTPMGRMHERDMSAIWKYGVAGDYNWDPLNLYGSCGSDYKGRKGLRDVELSHGRMAMLGITYFAAWEALTGHAIVENNMLFHPNLLFPFLALGYVGWNQIFEISPMNEYPIEVRYTNEGEMKYNRLKRGVQDVVEGLTSSTAAAKAQLDSLDSKFGIYEKVGTTVGSLGVMETIQAAYDSAVESYSENVVKGNRGGDN